jgi:hypothetical protein
MTIIPEITNKPAAQSDYYQQQKKEEAKEIPTYYIR